MTTPNTNTDTSSGAAKRVRTRFAPSPTGFLHVGALRTALFSFLLARHFGGDFVLRIEDTDQSRLVPGSLRQIIESLRAMGMMYDEGPDVASVANLDASKYGNVPSEILLESGGQYGPYFQSQRLPRYKELVERLLEEDKAYYAFETKEELDGMRAAADALKRPFVYRSKYRDYRLDTARERIAKGEAGVVRLKMPQEGPIKTLDALRGETIWDARTQDDFVILKADGFPPYHFAAIADDHDMQITHAVRSTEWLSSSPKHFVLYEALGWEAPQYIHVANVNGNDGKKLAKRTGARPVIGEYPDPKDGTPIVGFVNEGYLPDVLFNFLALVGWSPGDDSEVMTREEITEKFGLSGLATSPAIFDIDKMTWMNGVYLRRLSLDELVEKALPFLQKEGLVSQNPSDEERAYAREVIALEQERVKVLSEVPALTDFFFGDFPLYNVKSVERYLKKDGPGASAYLLDVAAALDTLPVWSLETIEETVRAEGAKHGREKGDLTHPVRVAVSGREVGPGLFEMMAVMGRARVQTRLKGAAEQARG